MNFRLPRKLLIINNISFHQFAFERTSGIKFIVKFISDVVIKSIDKIYL